MARGSEVSRGDRRCDKFQSVLDLKPRWWLQGEDQKKLDVISNEVFCNALRASGRTGVIASEEEDLPVAVEETYSGVGRCCEFLLHLPCSHACRAGHTCGLDVFRHMRCQAPKPVELSRKPVMRGWSRPHPWKDVLGREDCVCRRPLCEGQFRQLY